MRDAEPVYVVTPVTPTSFSRRERPKPNCVTGCFRGQKSGDRCQSLGSGEQLPSIERRSTAKSTPNFACQITPKAVDRNLSGAGARNPTCTEEAKPRSLDGGYVRIGRLGGESLNGLANSASDPSHAASVAPSGRLRRVPPPSKLQGPQGMKNEKVAPGPSLAVAHKRPRWASMMERLMDRPIPIPSFFVV